MADPIDTWEVERGSTPSRAESFVWADDLSLRDVSAAAATLTVYLDKPSNTLLFAAKTGSAGTDTSQKVFTLTTSDTASPAGKYLMVLELVTGGVVEHWHGTFSLVG